MIAPDSPSSTGEVKNNDQLSTGASKVGGGWQESVDSHTTTTTGNSEQLEHVVDDAGSNKEVEDGKGDGE
jgi:hypothetical protein